jgi:hypothetical protein
VRSVTILGAVPGNGNPLGLEFAAESGFNRTIPATAARRAGITLRRVREPFRVDAD